MYLILFIKHDVEPTRGAPPFYDKANTEQAVGDLLDI